MYRRIILLAAVATVGTAFSMGRCPNENKFEATIGCEQFDAFEVEGCNFAYPYISTATLHNTQANTSNRTVTLRMGVLGERGGTIRLSSVPFPYDSTTMHEIMFSQETNAISGLVRYVRNSPAETRNRVVLKQQSTLNMLSEFEPVMITLNFHRDGLLTITKDGDVVPFLEFRDSQLSSRFISFCNMGNAEAPVVYFFDCPLM